MARVPDLEKDPTITTRICDHLRYGAHVRDACEIVGVGERTYYQWLEKAADPKANPCYAQFSQAVTRALAEAKSALVGLIHKSARGEPVYDDSGTLVGYRGGDWRAAAHLLACRDPENYSIRKRFEHSGGAGKPIEVRVYDAINLPATEEEDDGSDEGPEDYSENEP